MFDRSESCARQLDAEDPLAPWRNHFHIPRDPNARELIYFAGNSLGLQPKAVRDAIEQELADWAMMGVDGHFKETRPWYSYHELLNKTGASLVGARPGEVVAMNSLTVNLHLMMATFYRPTKDRYKILTQYPAFPSDMYALKTHLRWRARDPSEALVVIRPPQGEHLHRVEDFEAVLESEGSRIALVMLECVSFLTGQAFDIERITRAAKRQGCIVGWDLAHAAGNIPLQLHDWGVDVAVWCNYKYLNSGPGAVGSCFVHEEHANNVDLPRLGGWWGNDPSTRFEMHLRPDFVPQQGAAGWQISNPPILSLAPVKVSYDMFDEVGMTALRHKSERLTGYLRFLLDEIAADRIEIMTPREPQARGCQLSLLVRDRPQELLAALHAEGVVCDFRGPNVIRVAPVPLYNTYYEAWRFAQVMARHVRS